MGACVIGKTRAVGGSGAARLGVVFALACAMIAGVMVLLGAGERAAETVDDTAAGRGGSEFFAVDVYVDAGSSPLAAYQVLIEPAAGALRQVKFVGIEGSDPAGGSGGAAAFAEPPFYDPEAMMHERVVLAAYSTLDMPALPTGAVRVARVHCMVDGVEPDEAVAPAMWLRAELQAAGDQRGERIAGATVSLRVSGVAEADQDDMDGADQNEQGVTP